jgi:pilus assembly protein CpaE
MDRPTVLLIDGSEGNALRERLSSRPEWSVVGSTSSPDIGFTLAERHQPSVILLNVDMPGNRGPALAESLSLEMPASSLILLTSSDSQRVLHLALQVGAKDVITLPVDDDRLLKTVERVAEQGQKRQQLFSVQKKSPPQFKTITVFSTKGGVGKTTVALNLALALRELTRRRVVVVDLDLLSGNLGLMAGVVWKRTIKDLVDDVSNVDKEMLDAYCVEHPTGIRILPAPLQPDFASLVQAEQVQKVLDLMSQVFNYVIVDAPTYLHDTVLPALEESHEIIVVTTLDLASIQNMKQCLDLLTRLSMRAKVKVVVNRVGYTGGLKIKDLENEMGMPVQCVLPSDERLSVDAVNMGTPVFLSARNSVLARRIEELALKVMSPDDRQKAPFRRPVASAMEDLRGVAADPLGEVGATTSADGMRPQGTAIVPEVPIPELETGTPDAGASDAGASDAAAGGR